MGIGENASNQQCLLFFQSFWSDFFLSSAGALDFEKSHIVLSATDVNSLSDRFKFITL